MAILNPEHLFEQAEKLIAPSQTGAPRQVDLRRAVSSAYYGLFHATLTAAADQFIGVTKQSTPQYSLVYRSVDHRSLRALCLEVLKPTLPAKYAPINHPTASGPISRRSRRRSSICKRIGTPPTTTR
ncbi:MAG: hypothetical protein ACREE9_01270 [Stellaceae bacterium]